MSNGIYNITLNGRPERIQFNQFARAELSKHLLNPGQIVNELELTQIIIDKAKDNLPALIKMIVYAGVLGDSLVYGFAPRLTQEQVGQFIADAPNEELYAIWNAFLQNQTIKGDSSKEPETEVEKKN